MNAHWMYPHRRATRHLTAANHRSMEADPLSAVGAVHRQQPASLRDQSRLSQGVRGPGATRYAELDASDSDSGSIDGAAGTDVPVENAQCAHM